MSSLEDNTAAGRRARNPVSYKYPDSDDEEEKVEEGEEEIDANNDVRVRPTIHNWDHWSDKSTVESLAEFQSVDGERGLRTCGSDYWTDRRWLHWVVVDALRSAEKSLVDKQDDVLSVELEQEFSRESKLTQVPYRK